MRIPGAKTARSFSRWVRARLLGGALILGYHRVAHIRDDAYEVCVSPANFAEHLENLRKYANPIKLSKLVEYLQAGSLPPHSVAVTFDDGYVDNLYEARPLLEKYAVPATVFVCTGYAGREFWWDELERLVMASQADPQSLHLQVGESRFNWDPPIGDPEAAGWSVRRRFRHALYYFLLSLNIEHLNQAMDTIRSWAGLQPGEPANPRAMTHQELVQLADGDLIELGSHTRHHPMLSILSSEGQREEIISGKQDLETVLGRPVRGFAYPNGRAFDSAKQIVREADFAYACTSLHDVVRPSSDMYELTRFWQKDVGGDKFMQGLKLWMGRSAVHA
jgi:peptidoglycan/xylan/chitin deacetylase (PgdA/CDA1 family)